MGFGFQDPRALVARVNEVRLRADRHFISAQSFLTWDASVSKAFAVGGNELTLTVGCKNITDEYQENLDQGADRDAGYVYGPRQPRTLFASAKYAF